MVSLALLGAAVGALIAGPSSDAYGRKPAIIVADVLFVAGSTVMACASSLAVLMVGRLLVGLAIGVASAIVPIYLSEVAPIAVRGRVVAIFVACITAGQAVACVVALLLDHNWRLMLGIAAVPAAIQGIW